MSVHEFLGFLNVGNSSMILKANVAQHCSRQTQRVSGGRPSRRQPGRVHPSLSPVLTEQAASSFPMLCTSRVAPTDDCEVTKQVMGSGIFLSGGS